MEHIYRTKGTCSREISFELDGDKVRNVHFVGGCDGNLKAVSKLVDGMSVAQIKALLRGNTCGPRMFYWVLRWLIKTLSRYRHCQPYSACSLHG